MRPIIETAAIETERLILRPPQPQDSAPWMDFLSDPEATRFLGGPYAPAMAWRFVNVTAGGWLMQGFSMFSVIEKASGQWIGRLGPWFPAEWPGTEIGWGLVRAAWGKGYATEGAAAAADWAFANLGWTEMIHTIAPENTPSIAVAKRLGSRLLGNVRLPPPINTDVQSWGQTRAEWQARQRR